MKVLIALNSFKGSLSALKACKIVKKASLELFNYKDEIEIIPIVDGGTGSLESWNYLLEKELLEISTVDPLGKDITASIIFDDINKAAYIEMATASGIDLINVNEKTVMKATSYGTGLLIRQAISLGALNIYLGIGGSATHDLGTGILRALGVRFLDVNNNILKTPEELLRLNDIDYTALNNLPKNLKINFLCDVNNPLLGKDGAAQVYAPQKGAINDSLVKKCEQLSLVFTNYFNNTFKEFGSKPGDGAAGGLPSIIRFLIDSSVKPGIELLREKCQLDSFIASSKLIITGEGSFDEQSFFGKGPGYLINKAIHQDTAIIVLCGQIKISSISNSNVFYFPINRVFENNEIVLSKTEQNLYETAHNAIKLFKYSINSTN